MKSQNVNVQYLNVHLNDLNSVAKDLVKRFGDIKIWLFEGDMGAGKTTLIRYLCDNIGIDDFVDSPTYNIINEYKILKKEHKGCPEYIYHFDLYRLNKADDLLTLDIFDYVNSNNYCFFEWPSKLSLLQKNATYSTILDRPVLLINIDTISLDTRNIFPITQFVLY